MPMTLWDLWSPASLCEEAQAKNFACSIPSSCPSIWYPVWPDRRDSVWYHFLVRNYVHDNALCRADTEFDAETRNIRRVAQPEGDAANKLYVEQIKILRDRQGEIYETAYVREGHVDVTDCGKQASTCESCCWIKKTRIPKEELTHNCNVIIVMQPVDDYITMRNKQVRQTWKYRQFWEATTLSSRNYMLRWKKFSETRHRSRILLRPTCRTPNGTRRSVFLLLGDESRKCCKVWIELSAETDVLGPKLILDCNKDPFSV